MLRISRTALALGTQLHAQLDYVGCQSQQHGKEQSQCSGSQLNDSFIGVLPRALGASKGCQRISRQVSIILYSAPLNKCHFDVLTNPNEKNHLALSKRSIDLRIQRFTQVLTYQVSN